MKSISSMLRFLVVATLVVTGMSVKAHALVIVDNTATLLTGSDIDNSYSILGFDASGSDKLVVAFGSEGNGGTKLISGVTYGGVSMFEAVQHTHSTGSQTAAIFFLDNPGAAGDIVVNWSGNVNGIGMAALALSGTTPGFSAVNGNDGTAVNLTTLSPDSFVVGAFVANEGTAATAEAPLTQVFAGNVGSAEGAVGTRTVADAGPVTLNFTGSSSRPVSVGVAFAANDGITPEPLQVLAVQNFENPASGLNFTVVGLDTDLSGGTQTAFGELSDFTGGTPNVPFTGQEGVDYFYGQRTDAATKSITFAPVNLTGFEDTQILVALAANTGVWDLTPDDFVVELDKDNDGTFETTLADFSPPSNNGSLTAGGGVFLSRAFQEFQFLLPEDANNAVLRFRFVTSGDNFETVAIDNIRFMGRALVSAVVVPEPASAALSLLALGALVTRRRRVA